MDLITGHINRLYTEHPDLALILAEVLRKNNLILSRQEWIYGQLQVLMTAEKEPEAPQQGLDLTKVAQSLWFKGLVLLPLAPAAGLTLKEALTLMLG